MQQPSSFAMPNDGTPPCSSASISNLLWNPPPLQLANVAKSTEPKFGKRRKELNPALRSRTYYRRKEEKEMLEKELQAMNLQLQHLTGRGEFIGTQDEITARLKHNQELRDSIREQRIVLANMQSIVSEFMRAGDHTRYEPVIRLGTDRRERYNTLLSMKQQRLQEAVYYLSERSRYMTMDKDFTDLQRFQSDNGDMCLMRFDIKPLPKAQSHFRSHRRHYHSRNDDEDWESSVAQHRLVTSINPNVKVDTNIVTFTEYWGDGSGPRTGVAVGDEVGIAVCNYVHEDELYPYHVAERVRQDITFHVMVAKYSRQRPSLSSRTPANTAVGSRSSTTSDCGSTNSYKTREDVVVATRWICLRLRKPPFPLDDDIGAHIRDGMEQVGQSMFTAIRHSVNGGLTARNDT